MSDEPGGVLDDLAALSRIDAAGMLAAIATIPDQLRDGWARSRDLELPDAHRNARGVAVLGMGGSAIGGDLVRGIWSDRLRSPVEVVRGYDLPAWIGRDTLVVASSYSGATEETISTLEAALKRACPVVVISTGGPIHQVATRGDLPLLTFPGGGQPRTAVGYSPILLAGLLERAGILDLDDREVAQAADTCAVAVAEFAPSQPTERNLAKQLAWMLVDRLPVIEASGFLAPVARRWKTQLNENGKSMAVVEELPEATHNAIVGYGRPESIRDHQHVVFLSSPLDHPRNTGRAQVSGELLSDAFITHQTITIEGPSRLAQAYRAIVLGDLASVYLAALYGVDPTPVDAIGRVKARLTGGKPTGSGARVLHEQEGLS